MLLLLLLLFLCTQDQLCNYFIKRDAALMTTPFRADLMDFAQLINIKAKIQYCFTDCGAGKRYNLPKN